jgi:hypothetical protein
MNIKFQANFFAFNAGIVFKKNLKIAYLHTINCAYLYLKMKTSPSFTWLGRKALTGVHPEYILQMLLWVLTCNYMLVKVMKHVWKLKWVESFSYQIKYNDHS